MSIRGKMSYRERGRQINDFSGLVFERNITPTDIDAMIDFAGKLFVYIELKYGNAPMPPGQRRALEAAVKSHNAAKNKAFAILARHTVENPEDDVDVSIVMVDSYYNGKSWRPPLEPLTVREAVDAIKQKCEEAEC